MKLEFLTIKSLLWQKVFLIYFLEMVGPGMGYFNSEKGAQMSKLRDKLMDYVLVNSTVSIVIQEKPYSAVQMSLGFKDKLFTAKGFSKVKWPDVWNDEFGYNLACQKAASKIVKQLLESKDYIY